MRNGNVKKINKRRYNRITKVLCLFIIIRLAIYCKFAQAQQGFVKTIDRPNKPDVALSGVTIRMRGMMNAVVSSQTGEFNLVMANKKDGDAIVIQSVQKNGFEL